MGAWRCLAGVILALVGSAASAKEFPKSAEDALIVDCLLPGQVRKMGRINSFVAPRRPARSSQFECALRGGEYVEFDRATLASSVAVWSGAAQGGDVEAMVVLGEALAKGLGAAPDYAQALFWFQRAGDRGDKRALQNLGHMYELGLGVPVDRERALEFYRRASGVDGERLVFVSTQLTEAQLSSELGAERERRDTAERELAALRAQRAVADREIEAKRAEVARLKAEAARAPKPEDVVAMWGVLEEQIESQERVLRARESDIQRLQTALLDAPDVAQSNVYAIGPLTMELVEPVLLASRGERVAAVRGERLTIAGKIAPRDALDQLWIGEQRLEVDELGLFSATRPAAESGRVQLTVVDSDGARSAFDFIAVRSDAPRTIAASVGVGGVARAWPASLKLGQRRALIIANQRYAYFAPLETPVRDGEAIAAVLRERYGFAATVLRDATRVEMLLALDALRREAKADDDVLVYYAGHGVLDSGGAWAPVDGKNNASESLVPNRAISEILAGSAARSVLVIADSCYAASMSRSALPMTSGAFSDGDWQRWATATGAGRSRLALTSGGLRPALDGPAGGHSAFANALLAVLKRTNGALETQRLYREVAEILTFRALEQPLLDVPMLAPLRFAGHEQGELVLAAK